MRKIILLVGILNASNKTKIKCVNEIMTSRQWYNSPIISIPKLK